MWCFTCGYLLFVTNFEILFLEIFMCNPTDEARLPDDNLSHTFANEGVILIQVHCQ